jgi:hypothetical protein
MGIFHSLLVQWRGDANVENMRGSSNTKKSLHVRPDGTIMPVQDELHEWLFTKHEQGIVIMTSHLLYKAASLLDATTGFKEKTFGTCTFIACGQTRQRALPISSKGKRLTFS